VDYPYFKQTLLMQRLNIVSLFECKCTERLLLREQEEKLALHYHQLHDRRTEIRNSLEEYSARTVTTLPDVEKATTVVDDAARLRWTAPDQPMYLSDKDRRIHCYFDRNAFVVDPVAVHLEFKTRTSWTDDERDIFIEKYGQHPKEFKRINAALPEKTYKDVIEFYYLKRYELNLKEVGAVAKKRGGTKKVISEGVAKRSY
jgi:hypothetical protein